MINKTTTGWTGSSKEKKSPVLKEREEIYIRKKVGDILKKYDDKMIPSSVVAFEVVMLLEEFLNRKNDK